MMNGFENLNNIKYYNKLPFKIFMDNRKPIRESLRYSITALTCSSGLIKPYTRIVDEFNRLYSHRAYMHYYNVNGIEDDEFQESLDDLYSLIKDYEVTTWDYNNFDIGEEEEEEEEEEEGVDE